jgi:hypothetical protein
MLRTISVANDKAHVPRGLDKINLNNKTTCDRRTRLDLRAMARSGAAQFYTPTLRERIPHTRLRVGGGQKTDAISQP